MKGMWDIHSHILNGIDDGARTLEEALAILKIEASQGVEHVILTPHYRIGMFEPDMELINQQYSLLKKAVREVWEHENARGSMKLYLGCEFHSNMDMIETLDAKRRPTMAGTRCVLVEFSSIDYFTYMRERCFSLLNNGYRPIIAHAERYDTLRQNNMKHLEELKEIGCLIQINASSILGEDGWLIRRWCHNAIKKNLVHFIASDAHDLSIRRPRMDECYALLKKKYGKSVARRLLIRNAQNLFMDER